MSPQNVATLDLLRRSPVYNQYNSPGRDARFWEKVDTSGGPTACWPWMGSRDEKGYGTFNDGRTRKVHRVSFEMAYEAIPVGLCVCHSCDNPPCVNPAHLWLGTKGENTRDAAGKGRLSKHGRATWNSKLTEDQVRDIRRRRAAGERRVDLARKFGLNESTVFRIVRYRMWQNVPLEEQLTLETAMSAEIAAVRRDILRDEIELGMS